MGRSTLAFQGLVCLLWGFMEQCRPGALEGRLPSALTQALLSPFLAPGPWLESHGPVALGLMTHLIKCVSWAGWPVWWQAFSAASTFTPVILGRRSRCRREMAGRQWMRGSCSMAPAPVSLTPSASRTLTGGSVVFMVLPTARVSARRPLLAEPSLPSCPGLGNHFKAN